MSNRRRLILAVGGVIGLIVAYYLISPLFIDRVVDEALPTARAAAPATQALPTEAMEEVAPTVEDTGSEASGAEVAATQTMEAAAAAPDEAATDDMPEGEMAAAQVLLTGEIYNLAHGGHGSASVYQLEDGSRVLRFEDFEVLNGPELHVWLVTVDPVPNTVGVDIGDYVELGALKGNIGNQNYDIPSEVVLENYPSVVIWCVPFRVPFNAAPLSPP